MDVYFDCFMQFCSFWRWSIFCCLAFLMFDTLLFFRYCMVGHSCIVRAGKSMMYIINSRESIILTN